MTIRESDKDEIEPEITVDPIGLDAEESAANFSHFGVGSTNTVGLEMTERNGKKKNPLLGDGSNVLHFPGDVSVVTQQDVQKKTDYVTLPRAELEAMVKREEVEAMLQQEREARQALEAMVKSLQRNQRPAMETFASSLDQEEIMQLVEDKLETFKPLDEEEWHAPFGESVFTLIYMCQIRSQSFLYSIFVFAVQIATIALTLADVAEDPIPHMVDQTVTLTQGLTMLLLLASQSDLIEAVLKLQDGFYPEVLKIHPGASYESWLISCWAQFFAGVLLLTTSFVLTMQASTVIDLMLNLTALLFMAEIDDLGFAMAKYGFITDNIQEQALAVADFKVPKRKSRTMHRRILYFLALVGLYLGYVILKTRQVEGHYLPTYIYVQFGDAYNPKIPYYSGILSSGTGKTVFHREYRDLGTKNILLAYCGEKKSWTFSEGDDPCKYFAKSLETETYDVTLIPDSDWQVLDSINRLQPFDSFSLVNRDCNQETCQGTCNAEGLCECPHDHFGLDCEYSDVCTKLAVDDRFELFPPVKHLSFGNEVSGAFAISNEFELLKNPKTEEAVRVYQMPVYYSNRTYPANIIFFGGRRWIMTSEWDLINMIEAKEESPETWYFPERTVATLESGFHGYHQAKYTPFFISDPVDFETPDFQPTPIGLKWWTIHEGMETSRDYEPDIALDTTIICDTLPPSCVNQPESFCGIGQCNSVTGLCDCNSDLYYHGDRCELLIPCYDQINPCGGNGVCDLSYGTCRCNLPYFGDLCEEHYRCYEEGGICKNGGVCNFTTGDCDCPEDPAMSGLACEKRADCQVFGCENGGVCGANGGCICPPPFQGEHCHLLDRAQEELFCSKDNDCENGSCNEASGICTCEDPASFGTLCQFQFNCSQVPYWVGDPCRNSGTCNPTTGVCDCTDAYFGPDCSKVYPCRMDEECGNGHWGTCDMDSGACKCIFGPIQGKRCEQPFSCRTSTDEYECFNGGSCNLVGACLCPTGYSGSLCESWVLDMYDHRWDRVQSDVTANITGCGFSDPYCNLDAAVVYNSINGSFGSRL